MAPGFAHTTPRLTTGRLGGFTKLRLQLILLTSFGTLYSDILLFRVGGFAVTLVHVMLAVTTAAILLGKTRIDARLALVFHAMLVVELCHALIFGFAYEAEWMKSFTQLAVYGLAFLLMAGVKLDRDDLLAIGPWLRKCAVFISSIGLAQFVLRNAGLRIPLPDSLRVKAYDPFSEHRAGGFVPANGVAVEPAGYALGLLTLLALLMFLDTIADTKARRASNRGVLMLLTGIVVTFSMSGIVAAGILIATRLLTAHVSGKLEYILLVFIVVLAMVLSGVISPIQSRLWRIARGADDSTLTRVAGSLRLLFAPPTSVERFFLGAGLGMEERDYATYASIYREVSLRDRVPDEVKIHNILAVVRFFQGWIGVILYGSLLGVALGVLAGRWRRAMIVFVFVVLLHFVTGLYLGPSTWATLGLLAIARRAQLRGRGSVRSCRLTRPAEQKVVRDET